MFYLKCFFLLFFISSAYGFEEHMQIGFSQFSEAQKLDGKKIQIRGFLYRSTKNSWILAAEPNLKSCCVGAEGKKNNQLVLIGEFNLDSNKLYQIAELQGIFHFKNNERYFLENPVLIESTRKSNVLTFSLIGIGLLLIGGIVTRLTKLRKL